MLPKISSLYDMQHNLPVSGLPRFENWLTRKRSGVIKLFPDKESFIMNLWYKCVKQFLLIENLSDLHQNNTFSTLGFPPKNSWMIFNAKLRSSKEDNLNTLSTLLFQTLVQELTLKEKELLTLLDACLQGTIGNVVIAHRDRLCRFGYELIEQFIRRAGGNIVVLGPTDRHVTSEEELAADLLSIVHIYSCRQMGKRKYRRNHDHAVSSSETEVESPTT